MMAGQLQAQAVCDDPEPSKQKHFTWTLQGLEEMGETETRTIGILQNGKVLVQQQITGDLFEFDLNPRLARGKTVEVWLMGEYEKEGRSYSTGDYFMGGLDLKRCEQVVYVIRQQNCLGINPFK
jgi:hypothetical protein